MQGLVQKLSQQQEVSSNQILDVTRRSMEQNLVMYGVDNSVEVNDPKQEHPMYTTAERPKFSALEFLKKELGIDLDPEDIWKVYRVGPFRQDRMRPLFIKVSYPAKDLIMEHIARLKGKSNPDTKQVYFISEQVPEGITEPKKQAVSRAKTYNLLNEKRPRDEKQKIQVINDKVIIDGEIVNPEVIPPQPSQLLFLGSENQKEIDQIQSKMVETDTKIVKSSSFTALALKVHSIEQIEKSYIAVMQRYPSADHVILGYAMKENSQLKVGFCDHREFGAGSRIKNTIFKKKARNTAVFVVRKFGGLHLGFNRFAIIEVVAKQAIDLLGN